MAKLFPRVGDLLVGLHLHLILVVPELSKTAVFSQCLLPNPIDLSTVHKTNDASPPAREVRAGSFMKVNI